MPKRTTLSQTLQVLEDFDQRLVSKIDDDQFQLFKTYLQSPDTAEPPTIERSAVTNRTFLQLYFAKIQTDITQNDMDDAICALFTINTKKAKSLTYGIYGKVSKMSPDELEIFLTKENNLDEIGPFCSKIGINYSVWYNFEQLKNVEGKLTNGAVIELSKEFTPAVLQDKIPHTSGSWSTTVQSIMQVMKREKSIQPTPEFDAFLNEIALPSADTVKSYFDRKAHKQLEAVNRCIASKFNSEVGKNKKLSDSLAIKEKVLSEQYKQLEQCKTELAQTKDSLRNLSEQSQKQIRELNLELNETKKKLNKYEKLHLSHENVNNLNKQTQGDTNINLNLSIPVIENTEQKQSINKNENEDLQIKKEDEGGLDLIELRNIKSLQPTSECTIPENDNESKTKINENRVKSVDTVTLVNFRSSTQTEEYLSPESETGGVLGNTNIGEENSNSSIELAVTDKENVERLSQHVLSDNAVSAKTNLMKNNERVVEEITVKEEVFEQDEDLSLQPTEWETHVSLKETTPTVESNVTSQSNQQSNRVSTQLYRVANVAQTASTYSQSGLLLIPTTSNPKCPQKSLFLKATNSIANVSKTNTNCVVNRRIVTCSPGVSLLTGKQSSPFVKEPHIMSHESNQAIAQHGAITLESMDAAQEKRTGYDSDEETVSAYDSSEGFCSSNEESMSKEPKSKKIKVELS